MSTIHQLYMQIDALCRKRADAQRWRVTINDDVIEVFRRPILTSEVTLGALGIGNAPMPVPMLCFTLAAVVTTPPQWRVDNHTTPTHASSTHDSVQAAIRTISQLIQQYTE